MTAEQLKRLSQKELLDLLIEQAMIGKLVLMIDDKRHTHFEPDLLCLVGDFEIRARFK